MQNSLRALVLAGALLAAPSFVGAQGSDQCANAQAIAGVGLFAFNNSAASTDGPNPPGCTQLNRDVWFAWTAPSTGTFTVETCGLASIDTVLAAYAGTSCPPGTPLACNDDSCSLQSRITFNANGGSTYLLRVGVFGGSTGGSGQIRVQAGGPSGGCPSPSTGPDVIVGALTGISRYGIVSGKTGYSIGTDSCNVGDQELSWISGNNQHPVIGQNIYRLKNDRFEQLGQSWLKHGFTALQMELCCDCIPSGTGSRLGVGCSDPYSSSLNGSQGGLGPRWQVNPYTGLFAYPYATQGQTGNDVYKRIQVANDDLSPALHPGARYYGEGQYVAPDDSTAGNQYNNVSYREILVGGLTSSGWALSFTGQTFREQAAIYAWQGMNPAVQVEEIFVPGDGLFIVASLATDNGNGTWSYEYAVYNMNVARALGSFSVPVPPGVSVTSLGFHFVESHSGDPYSNTPWPGQNSGGNVSWATEPYAVNPLANPVRWGTLYNYRFVADSPPTAGLAQVGLYEPGAPGSVDVPIPVPSASGGCSVASFCATAPNSAGPGATLSHTGSTSIAANDLTLVSTGAPANQFGVFFYGPLQTQVPYGDGNLCVHPGTVGVFRLLPLVSANGAGTTTKLVDFTQPPASSGPGVILPGSTWHFQHWFRDTFGPGGTGFNLTDGLSATFCP